MAEADGQGEDPEDELATDGDGVFSVTAAAASEDGGSPDEGEDAIDSDAHYGALDGVGVAVLRQRLRDEGEGCLATVKQADLPAGTPSSGAGKSEATKELLRRRLAWVLGR